MKKLYQAIDKFHDSASNIDDKELEMIIEFIGLTEDDHYCGPSLSRVYLCAKDFYRQRGLKEIASKYAQRALELDMRLLGPENPVTHECQVLGRSEG